MANEEFQDRRERSLGDISPESHPENQTRPRRRGASSINPPGRSPGRNPIGKPVGGWWAKRGYPYPPGMPGANTGQVPPPLVDPETGVEHHDELHPMPVQFTRAAMDYIVNTLRQLSVHVQQPGWMEPPFFSRCLDLFSPQGGVALAAAAPFTSVVQGPFTIPVGNVGVVWHIGQELDDPNGFDSVIWRIMRNGRPVEQYNNIGIQLGNIAFNNKIAAPIHLQPTDTIDFEASNPGAAPYVAYGRIMGWFFPAEIVDNSMRSRFVT